MTLVDFLERKKGCHLISFINKLKDYSSDGTILINGNSKFIIKEHISDGKVFIDIVSIESKYD